jgi:hypothetical protein
MKKVYLLVSSLAMVTSVFSQFKTEVYNYNLSRKMTNVLEGSSPAVAGKLTEKQVEKSISAIWSENFTVTTPLNTSNGTWVTGGVNSAYWTVGSSHPMPGYTDNMTGSFLIWNSYGPNANETDFASTAVAGEIVSPTIDLSTLTSGAMLSFKTDAMYCCHTSEIPFKIAVSENDGVSWSTPITLDFGIDRNVPSQYLDNPMTVNVDLSSLTAGASATTKIKFIWDSATPDANGQVNTHYFWLLDDLALYNKLDYDLALERLWLNDITTGYEHTEIPQTFGGNLTVQGRVKNYGKNTPTNVQLAVSIYNSTGGLVGTTQTGGTLANNFTEDYDTITFVTTIDLSALAIANYSVKAGLVYTETDGDLSNDTMRRTLKITDFYLGQRDFEAFRTRESAGRDQGTSTNSLPMMVGNVFSIPADMIVQLHGVEITLARSTYYGMTAGAELTVKVYSRDYSASSYNESFIDTGNDFFYTLKASDLPSNNGYKDLLINFNDASSFLELEGGQDYFIGIAHPGGTYKMAYGVNMLDDDNSSVIFGAFASTAGDFFFSNGNQIHTRLNFNPALIQEAGIKELTNTVGLAIYPNPATAQTSISFNLKEEAKVSVSIVDVTGKSVYANELGSIASGAHKVNVNTDTLSNGVYMVNVTSNGSVSTQKLVVRK